VLESSKWQWSARRARGAAGLRFQPPVGTRFPPETPEVEDLSPLITPVEAEFRGSTMGFGLGGFFFFFSEAQPWSSNRWTVSDTELSLGLCSTTNAEGVLTLCAVFLTPESAGSSTPGPTRHPAGPPPAPRCVNRGARGTIVLGRTDDRSAFRGIDDAQRPAIARSCDRGALTVLQGRIRSAPTPPFCATSPLDDPQRALVYQPVAASSRCVTSRRPH